jgi:hypothetical protein
MEDVLSRKICESAVKEATTEFYSVYKNLFKNKVYGWEWFRALSALSDVVRLLIKANKKIELPPIYAENVINAYVMFAKTLKFWESELCTLDNSKQIQLVIKCMSYLWTTIPTNKRIINVLAGEVATLLEKEIVNLLNKITKEQNIKMSKSVKECLNNFISSRVPKVSTYCLKCGKFGACMDNTDLKGHYIKCPICGAVNAVWGSMKDAFKFKEV